MSCSEVVYQAYYPYLYQRPSTSTPSQSRTSHFPPFSHNYDRFNVSAYGGGTAAQSSGSVSSGGGAGSPGSPLAHKDEDSTPAEAAGDDEAVSPGGSRAQYVSANCVVFTHYTGDVAAVVDEHFTRALSYKTASPNSAKESSPMSARNFPPSFWNSNYQGSSSVPSHHGELYGDPVYHNVPGASTDPWHHPHYQYTHHRAVHEYHHHHHHNMAAQYGSLLLPPPGRLPHQYHHAKPPSDWNRPQQHALDPGSSYASYPTMPGLEAQVSTAESKDLYWF